MFDGIWDVLWEHGFADEPKAGVRDISGGVVNVPCLSCSCHLRPVVCAMNRERAPKPLKNAQSRVRTE